ncbi:MAG: T9SS type A sorting domain-containing protein [Prolixibacteraceae bacterium]|nr:T9SS type A sorting domain-containing protein [Prolixibacteraceae bacterium]
MKYRNTISLLILIVIISMSTTGYGSKIIRPWRATTAIVKTGESFEVWFDAYPNQEIESIQLSGKYNTVNCTYQIETGDWEYDPLSKNRYNTRIKVTVPVDAPANRYDLALETSTGVELSHGGVKVVSEFKSDYYIMHMSDGHLYQHGHDTDVLLARKTAMIEIANIIDCEIIIETGDNSYNVRNHPEREVMYFQGDEEHGIKGMADANAATFLVPGDHDAYKGNDWPQASVTVNADFFNDYWGLQNSSFKYGNGRFMMLNNAWAVSETSAKAHEYQCDEAKTWLNNDGVGGNFFVTAGHCYNKMHEFIDDAQPLSLVLAGDKHHIRTNNPYSFDPGSAKVAYIAGSIRDHFEFNLFKVNNIDGTFSTVSGENAVVEVLASGDQNDRSTWQSNLTLNYSNKNNGSFAENTATIVNNFNFPIDGAKVRFVLAKGYDYIFTNATLKQQFEGDEFYIVDLTTDLPANGSKEIYIRAEDLCPDDPEKTEPGLCGCGVPEGTCASYSLVVNNGTGDGSYKPLEKVTITADDAPEGSRFYTWEINAGNPTIKNSSSITTTLTLGYDTAVVTATYKEIPKVNKAEFIKQDVPTFIPGNEMQVSITMKNTGTSTWTKEGGFKLRALGLQILNPWGIYNVELSDNETIEPGEEKTFVFDINVPTDKGVYSFQWQMLQEGKDWFGSKSAVKNLRIGSEGVYFDDCDKLTSWNSAESLKLNNTDNQQGEYCIEFEGNGTDEFKKSYAIPYNAGDSKSSLVLQFWYYISDASKMGQNQVELGSSGKPDSNELSWGLSDLSNGWNFISLKLSEAAILGNPDLKALNWFRFYNKKSGSIISRLDAIEIVDLASGKRFGLKVNNGDGDGNYYAGTIITIKANTAPSGKIFDKWTINEGAPIIENSTQATSTLTMPENNTEITATYKSNTTSIGNFDRSSPFIVYPNPASDIFYTEINIENTVNVSIALIDVSGRIIIQHLNKAGFKEGNHQFEISVSGIKPGNYIMEIILDNAKYTQLVAVN